MKLPKHLLPAGLVALALLLPDLASAQGDPFSAGAQWFVGGPARGVAMVAVLALGVAMWVFRASLGILGMVLGGGLVIANAAVAVGWMGF